MSDESSLAPLQVGDTIPTAVLENGNLVGAVMCEVVRVLGDGEYEIRYPSGELEIIRDSE